MGELFTSILVLSALGGLLALLLVIAERYIAAYGECTITVNKERELKVEGGGSLLTSLMSRQIFIPSACGGRGTCAYCKVKVLEGGGPMLPIETPYLSPEEREAGVRLSCQVKVRHDLAIEIPEEFFNVLEYRAAVEHIRDLTYDIKELRLKLTEPKSITFKAGQYIQLETPEYEGNREPVYRAYSMSSPPSENGAIELVIRLVPNGICTTWVFKHLHEGDEVSLNGPHGDFHLRDSDRKIVFVAGGSGFAPIKAMIESSPDEINRRGARFFFGAKARRDLFYTDVMRDIQSKYGNIRFIPALSAPDPEDNWDGEKGLITEVMAQHITDGSNTEYYLCGSPGMIDACIKVIKAKEVSEERIFYDKFE